MVETYYREENARWSDDRLAITVLKLHVVRRTAKGVWVVPEYWLGRTNAKAFEKFILDGKGKRYAYPSRLEARESFIIRKRKEIQHCIAQHDRAVRYLALAETMKFGERTEALHELHAPGINLPELPVRNG